MRRPVSVDVRLVRPPSAQAEELDWMARVGAGDRSACEALHRRHHEALWRLAYAHVRSADAAEAIVHDGFLSL
jgi:DNA-directed RNA polymerase specialized sigma24 family protein